MSKEFETRAFRLPQLRRHRRHLPTTVGREGWRRRRR